MDTMANASPLMDIYPMFALYNPTFHGARWLIVVCGKMIRSRDTLKINNCLREESYQQANMFQRQEG